MLVLSCGRWSKLKHVWLWCLHALDQKALLTEPSRKGGTRAQIRSIHSELQEAGLQPWRENSSSPSSHDMAGSPRARREVSKKSENITDLYMWKGRRTDRARRHCPESAGPNGQIGEGWHSLQEHALQAAEAAPPGSWWGWPGAMDIWDAQHRGPPPEQRLHLGH